MYTERGGHHSLDPTRYLVRLVVGRIEVVARLVLVACVVQVEGVDLLLGDPGLLADERLDEFVDGEERLVPEVPAGGDTNRELAIVIGVLVVPERVVALDGMRDRLDADRSHQLSPP